MKITDIKFRVEDDVSHFEAKVHSMTCPKLADSNLYIKINKLVAPPESLGDPFMAACLVPAMFLGESLQVEAPVSAAFLSNTNTIQDILENWYPDTLKKIEVHAPVLSDSSVCTEDSAKTASFFSGGVDSWHTLLKNDKEIDSLITVGGFDIALSDISTWTDLIKRNQQISAALGKELVLVETNLREVLDPRRANLGRMYHDDAWGKFLHGAFLSAVGLCLQTKISKLFVASSYPYIQLHPWGTHPLLDPLWSTERLHFLHDGCEANRMDKLILIAQSKLALENIRVCFRSDRYNCCRCEKCLRTMLALDLLGVLDVAPAFKEPLDYQLAERMRISHTSEVWYEDILSEAKIRGELRLSEFLEKILRRRFSLAHAKLDLKECLLRFFVRFKI